MKLKFEDKFAVGSRIKAYDFPPIEGCKKYFIEGTVESISDSFGVKGYIVRVEFDSYGARLGSTVFVPMETSMDFDIRVTALREAA